MLYFLCDINKKILTTKHSYNVKKYIVNTFTKSSAKMLLNVGIYLNYSYIYCVYTVLSVNEYTPFEK